MRLTGSNRDTGVSDGVGTNHHDEFRVRMFAQLRPWLQAAHYDCVL
jgi:hypothetical protein